MIFAPSHIKPFAVPLIGKNKYFCDEIYSRFTFAYEVCCSCGNDKFVIYKNSEPKVTAYCESCGKTITLYDLIEYSCAVTVRKDGEEVLKKITTNNSDKFNVAIIFEYSDEFELDDENFDENDVTWCQIYLYDTVSMKSFMIVDDETA